jgi:pheromone shutdown-related protein TraB
MTPEIIIVPTSHIARESLERVKDVISSAKPDCLAVELDFYRYRAMKSEGKESGFAIMRSMGPLTYSLYWLLKKLQEHLGGKTGILPGSDMMKAADLGSELGIPVAFIDQDIQTTFLGIKKIGLREKLKLIWLLIYGAIGMKLPLPGRKVELDLNKVPEKEVVVQAIGMIKKELPGLYKVLIDDRNRHMARKLITLSEKYGKIVCVIGAGHEDGIRKILESPRKGSTAI